MLQSIRFSEFSDFEPHESVVDGQQISDLGISDLSILEAGDRLVVTLLRDPQNAAIGGRVQPHNVEAFSLAPGEWGRIEYNGRYVDRCTGDWWYERSVYNIGFVVDPVANSFIATKPDRRYAEMAILR